MIAAAIAVLMDGSGNRRRPSTPIEFSNYEALTLFVSFLRQDGTAQLWSDFSTSVLTVRTSVGATVATLARAITGSTLSLGRFDVAALELPIGSYTYDIHVIDADDNAFFVTTPASITVKETSGRPGVDPVDPIGPDALLVGVPVPGVSDAGKVLAVATLDPLTFEWVVPAAGASPASTVTDVASTGVVGVSALYARGDHVHAYHPPNCLYFPTVAEGGPTHVDFGSVYAANTQFGQFFFEAWLRWDSGQYFISDGYGGGHALLLGVTPGTGTVAGNFWDSGSIQSFASEDVVVAGEWFHAAVGYNGVAIEVYINGVPCGRKAYTGQRWSSIANWYVGGSDHQNFYGAIATMRLLEGYCPTTRASFRPDRFVGTKFGLIDAYGSIKWMADFTRPATIIADHGVTGGHPGRLCNAGAIDSVGLPLYADPVPYWIYDENCPVQTPSPDPSLWGAAALTPPSTPGGARFFDSFSRADQTRATPAADYVGLGTGEATGTLGALTWTDPGSYFGIFKGRVFIINLAQRVLAYVENGVADMDVSVDRNGAVGDVGLVLRLVNSTNYVKVWYHNSIPLGNGGDNHIRVSVVVNGVVTADVVNAVPTGGFTTLRCKVKTVLGVSTYSVYTDGNLIGTGTDETHLTATKAGIYTEWYTSSVYANAHGRMDNFTIYATP